MEVRVKKTNIVALVGFVCVVTGYSIFSLILKSLIENGWYGFIVLAVFLGTLIFLVNFFTTNKYKAEAAAEVAKEMVTDKLKNDPKFFNHTSTSAFQNEIETRLLKKLDGETYTIFRRKAI